MADGMNLGNNDHQIYELPHSKNNQLETIEQAREAEGIGELAGTRGQNTDMPNNKDQYQTTNGHA